MSQQINLYEARLHPSRELPTARNLSIVTLALLVLMSSFGLWANLEANRQGEAAVASRKQLGEEQGKLLALSKLAAQRRVSPALAAATDHAQTMLATRQEVVQFLDAGRLGNSSGFSAFLSGFSRQAQTDLWLTGFRLTQGGEGIEIRGRLLDPARLPAYVQRLSAEPVFQGRRFAALEMHGVEPDERKADQPPATKAVDPATDPHRTPMPRAPRFVEFTLRSENAGVAATPVRAGETP